jgi:hypothetical protein|tara:strand:+ start:49 stop:432 length:384 start_codon:yes stop_codon:yes gene_type:complete
MGLFSFVKAGKKVFDTVKSVKPNVGNLKKNQETIKKLTDTTDKYVKKANEKGFKDLAKDLRKSGSKSLQKTEKILRKKKKDGGRMGLKRGGGKFPDHSGDGKITQKDILMAKGVIPKTKSKSKKKVV